MGTTEKEEPAQEEAPEGPSPAPFPSFLLSLFDKTNLRLLQATAGEYLAVKEIAKASGLPIRACYRRVRALYREGLLRMKQTDPDGGRPSSQYRSFLGDMQVVLSGSQYNVSLVWPGVRFDLSVDFS